LEYFLATSYLTDLQLVSFF